MAPDFTDEERSRIADAIARAEAATSGEIVVVAAKASEGYRSFAVLWAALIALAVPLSFIFFTRWSLERVYLIELLVFLLLAIVGQWPVLRYWLVPGSIKRAAAHRRALAQFSAQNLYTTKNRTGVLIYVSFAEHFAEIVADQAIYEKVPQAEWSEIVAELTHHVGRGMPLDGFLKAISHCGAVLATHFPRRPTDHDELPNHLIVLDAP